MYTQSGFQPGTARRRCPLVEHLNPSSGVIVTRIPRRQISQIGEFG